MYTTKKIAILLATFNAEKYIGEQLESILKQSYSEFNIYIHDDGSTDRTVEIIENYCMRYPDKIFILEGKPNGSARDNFFYLMKKVEAPLYMFSDQDDVWLDDKVEVTYKKMKKMLNNNKDKPLLVSTDLKVVNEELEILSESMREYSKIRMNKRVSLNKLLIQNYAVGCTLMFNFRLRELAITSYNPRIIMHDWWLALIAQVMGVYENIDYAGILYRQHGKNSVGASNVNLGYAVSKISSFKEKYEIIRATRLQVKAFCAKFPDVKNKLMDEYAGLDKKNKLYRMCYYVRHGINKQGILRKIGIIMFC